MAKDKISMPTSTAGITRYFDDYKSKIRFQPGSLIIMVVIVILVMIILHTYGYSMLGLK
jgi:preprotein translocase subunit Sec61beta